MTPVYRFIRRKFYFLSSLFARSTSLLAEFSVRRVSSTFPLRWYSRASVKSFFGIAKRRSRVVRSRIVSSNSTISASSPTSGRLFALIVPIITCPLSTSLQK